MHAFTGDLLITPGLFSPECEMFHVSSVRVLGVQEGGGHTSATFDASLLSNPGRWQPKRLIKRGVSAPLQLPVYVPNEEEKMDPAKFAKNVRKVMVR